ncbi:TetR/AcrR family transcriptional regulator [Gluconacetobacter asukensis]|uniref:TetR/AcrR family transcriptional regulator n=1 Tax=Gluconacetobacter asukensis TaxID=1017181 RepID=A0A7W4IY59_9PROT|nr:TetR/AcrR family transcriptional regulator [Gluconacetobacter asukensis]MBB2171211.1 TetR/AcrR family transcriptional regulator [Gluconacetobacter asukensis]
MCSTSSRTHRTALQPQRAVGRQRVADLLVAASDLIAEHGYEATTMAAIAKRAGARVGSLYRFFPNKEAIADTLLHQHLDILREAYDALGQRAAGATPEELADLLIDLLTTLYPRVKSLPALMDVRTDRTELSRQSRATALGGISAALIACAPKLDRQEADDIATVMLNSMKTMLGMALKTVPTSPGAPAELRLMNRLYLAARLTPLRSG